MPRVSDPGGVLSARQSADGTAAFYCGESIGFGVRFLAPYPVRPQPRSFSGLHHTACVLAPSSFRCPLRE
jgi:hypothetical protein